MVLDNVSVGFEGDPAAFELRTRAPGTQRAER
jgi:hypothetical protein